MTISGDLLQQSKRPLELTSRMSLKLKLLSCFVVGVIAACYVISSELAVSYYGLPISCVIVGVWIAWRENGKVYKFETDRIIILKKSKVEREILLRTISLYCRTRHRSSQSLISWLCGYRLFIQINGADEVSLTDLAFYEPLITKYFIESGVKVDF